MATLVAHHYLTPPPLALLSITGIATFQHPFFSSSVCLAPKPSTEDDMAQHMAGPAVVGVSPPWMPAIFTLDKLSPDGAKNLDYSYPAPGESHSNRGDLYEYYLHRNEFPALVGAIDSGFDPKHSAADWPPTVIIHGDSDPAVAFDVSLHMQKSLGEDKVKLFVAKGQAHLFEDANWWEDETEGMGTVRDAVACLDSIMKGSTSE